MKPRLLEKLWDCPYCGTVGIKGRYAECPHCGTRREGGIEFYRKELSYVDEETAKTINRNPDWCCSYCNGLNSDDYKECQTCGATRESSDKNYFDKLKEKKEKEAQDKAIMDSYNTYNYNGSTKEDNSKNKTSDLEETSKYSKENSFNFGSFFKYIVGGLLGVLAIFFLVTLFVPKEKNITIDDFSWNRNIDIEQYQTVDEEGWTLPSKARLHSSEERIKGYQDVLDHYETKSREVAKERLVGYEDYVSGYRDLGNGYEEEIISQRPIYETYYETETWEEPVYRQEPIYATYYFYEIDKWLYERSIKTNGYDQNPYWGDFSLSNDERKGNTSERYYIHFTNEDGEKEKYSINYNDWQSLEKGQTLKVKVSFGTIVEIIGIDIEEDVNSQTSFNNRDNVIELFDKKNVA